MLHISSGSRSTGTYQFESIFQNAIAQRTNLCVVPALQADYQSATMRSTGGEKKKGYLYDFTQDKKQ